MPDNSSTKKFRFLYFKFLTFRKTSINSINYMKFLLLVGGEFNTSLL